MSIFKKLCAVAALFLGFSAPAMADFSSPSIAIVSSAGVDAFACTTIGSVLSRQTTGWKCTTPGLAGQVLVSAGAGANLTWFTPTGNGTVTSVAATVPAFMGVSGSPIAGAGTLAFSFNSQAANLLLASPNGSAGVPTFRAIVAGDLGAGTMIPTFAGVNGSTGASLNITAGSGQNLALGANATPGSWGISTLNVFYPTTDSSFDIGAGSFRVRNVYAVNLGASVTPISNLYLTEPATTFFGNPTNASANATQFTIQGLADVSAPSATADWMPIYNASSGTLKKVNASEISAAINTNINAANIVVTNPAATSVAQHWIGTGTTGALSSSPLWTTWSDYSTAHSVALDFQAVNSAGVLKDQAFYLNPGFQWWDAGHEQSAIDFNGYVNGVSQTMVGITGGCLASFNNNGNGIACPTTWNPSLLPGTTALFDLGTPAYNWQDGYFSRTVYSASNVRQGGSPTLSGTCAGTSQLGGATAGEFITTAGCTGTFILTFPAGVVAPHGWSCNMRDVSRPGFTFYALQSGRTINSATFSANVANGDLMSWDCTGY